MVRTSDDDATEDDPALSERSGPGTSAVPTQVRVAVVITALETIGVLVYALVVAVAATRTPGTVSAWPVEVAIYLVFAGGLAVVVRGLAAGRAFARSPFVVAQMFGLIVGWTLLSGTEWVRILAIAVLAMSGIGLAAGLSPALREYLGR